MAEDAPKEIPGFKLNALREIIKQHFNADTVSVVYLTEGGLSFGMHLSLRCNTPFRLSHLSQIYDCHMTSASGASLPRVVARIAFPVFPRDKVASEVMGIILNFYWQYFRTLRMVVGCDTEVHCKAHFSPCSLSLCLG